MNKFIKNIDNQIEFNRGKNIFLDDNSLNLRFIDDTIKAISEINELSNDSEKMLLDYVTDKVLEEFCRISQYYTFNSQDKNDLREVYNALFSNIKKNEDSIETISRNHYHNLNIVTGKQIGRAHV